MTINVNASIKTLVSLIVKTADDLKALDLVVLDLRNVASFADYLIVGSSTSNRHGQAIVEHISKAVKTDIGQRPLAVEGWNTNWVLVDYGDVICHVFSEEARVFYRLEHLWHDAKKMDISQFLPAKAVPATIVAKTPEKVAVKKSAVKKPVKKAVKKVVKKVVKKTGKKAVKKIKKPAKKSVAKKPTKKKLKK